MDWKATLQPDDRRSALHLSAFANTPNGGYLVFGISNDGAVLGLPADDADRLRNRLATIARDGLEPQVRVEFDYAPDPLDGDRQLLYVRVHEASRPPVKLRGKSIEESYVRTGAGTRRMTDDELRDALRRAPGTDLLDEVLPGLSGRVEDLLDLPAALARLRPTQEHSPEGLLRAASELAWVDLRGAAPAPTTLGLLLAAKDFRRVPGFESFGARLIRYPGATRVTLDGPQAEETRCATGVLFAAEACLAFLRIAAPRIETLRGSTRYELPAWPESCLREAVVNALVHRDYGRREPVLIEAFRDRLEIASPGGLLPHQTPARVLDQPPRSRNPRLYEAARLAGLVEARGRGVDLMVAEAEAARLPSPAMRDDGASFKLVFEGPKDFDAMTIEERVWNAELHVALAYEERRPATNATLRERFGLAKTPSHNVAVSRLLARCVELGRIRAADPEARTRAVRYVPAYV